MFVGCFSDVLQVIFRRTTTTTDDDDGRRPTPDDGRRRTTTTASCAGHQVLQQARRHAAALVSVLKRRRGNPSRARHVSLRAEVGARAHAHAHRYRRRTWQAGSHHTHTQGHALLSRVRILTAPSSARHRPLNGILHA